jgi:protocatechuate 3,4-dioxygenase beta subunit
MLLLRSLCGVGSLVLAFGIIVSGQAAAPGQTVPDSSRQVTPTRDRQTPSKGTAILRGHVVDATTGQPLRRVNVNAYPEFGRDAFAGRGAVTDGEGRFEIRDVAAGKYSVSAYRPGYLSMVFGQRGVSSGITSIEVRDGQTVDKIVLRLTRGGVITGRVVDEFGDPAVNAHVQVLRYQFQNGGRRLSPAGGGFSPDRTDDRGEFRLYGLPPGQYYVSARPEHSMRQNDAAEASAPALSYYPNSPDPGGAQRVTIAAGRETSGINIALVSTRVVRVRGRAVHSNGEPFAGGFVNFMQRHEFGGSFNNSSARVAADGIFEARNVQPGRYTLTVRPSNARDDDDSEVGYASIVVGYEDLDNVMIVGSRGGILRGSFVTDEGVPMPIKASSLMVHVNPADNEPSFGMRPPRVQDDYTFELKGLFGRLRISPTVMMDPASGPGMEWGQKAILWRGEDVTDQPFEFDPGQVIEDVQIVYSRRWANLSGTVTDDRGSAVESWLVLFTTDENKWTGQSRHVRTTRSTAQGEYRFPRLPQGEAYLAAVSEMEPGQAQDPEFLRGLRDRAIRIAIGDGTTHTQNLRVSLQ